MYNINLFFDMVKNIAITMLIITIIGYVLHKPLPLHHIGAENIPMSVLEHPATNPIIRL